MDNTRGEMDKECYIRYRGKRWEPATIYHRHALSQYVELQSDKRTRRRDPILIITNRYDGSLFVANFREKTPAIYAFQEVGMEKREEKGEEEVEIMFCAVSLPCSVART